AVAVLAVGDVEMIEPDVVRAVADVHGVRAGAALVVAVAARPPHGQVANDDVAHRRAADADIAVDGDPRSDADDRLVRPRRERPVVGPRLDQDDRGARALGGVLQLAHRVHDDRRAKIRPTPGRPASDAREARDRIGDPEVSDRTGAAGTGHAAHAPGVRAARAAHTPGVRAARAARAPVRAAADAVV